jgi:hypothetical protein
MRYLLFFINLCLIPFCYAADNTSLIHLIGEPNETLLNGQTLDLTADLSSSVSLTKISIKSGNHSFEFLPPNGQNFTTKAYLKAQRVSYKNPYQPDMYISYNYRSCPEIVGEFYIYELDTHIIPAKLALDFKQRCADQTEWLYGQIRINSDLALPISLPTAILTTDKTLYKEGETVNIDLSQSFSTNSSIKTYQLEQLSGSPLPITNDLKQTLTLPINLALGGEDVSFKLSIMDNQGITNQTVHTIHISSKSDPETYLKIPLTEGELVSRSLNWNLNSENSLFNLDNLYGNNRFIRLKALSISNWYLNFTSPNDNALAIGIYQKVAYSANKDTSTAGLDISSSNKTCSQTYGNFEIKSIRYENNKPVSLRANFEQACDSPTAIPLKGELAINAPPLQAPTTNAGADIQVYEGQIINLDGSNSFDADGTINKYAWLTNDSSLTIQNADKVRANFIAPALKDRENSRTFSINLLVTDNEGYQAQDSVNINVLSANKAPITQIDNFIFNKDELNYLDPLNNDSDLDGTLNLNSINIIDMPKQGTVTIQNAGLLTYTPTSNAYPLQDSFSYTVKDNDGAVSSPTQINILIKDPLQRAVPIKAFLQGAYDNTTGLMTDTLRSKNLIPLLQPYKSFGYTQNIQTNSTVLAVKNNNSPVDWVLVEFYDNAHQLVMQQAALVQRDGDIANANDNTVPLLINNLSEGSYFIKLKHRNHLAIETMQPVIVNDKGKLLDFTSANLTTHSAHDRFINDSQTLLMWAGDIDHSNNIIGSGPNNDVLNILGTIVSNNTNLLNLTNFIVSGYLDTDINLDGSTIFAGSNNDVNLLLGNILLHPDNKQTAANFIINN